MKSAIKLNPNPLVQYLNKTPDEFTKEDLIRYIDENGVKMINFRYPAGDGRLKALNFIIHSKEHLNSILSAGERVDGSSLFSHIEPGSSDLYVIPRYRTAFMNPFSEIPTMELLCSYYDQEGKPLESSPEYTLKKAHDVLKRETGYTFEVMGELEYYIISDKEPLYTPEDQKGYHATSPFTKWEHFRIEAMEAIAEAGGMIKYGHSEVGNFIVGDTEYEQSEIEFLPTSLEDAADQLVIAKWILRKLAYNYGVTVTFAPKITVGKAGSGLHIHTRLMKNGKNVMVKDGKLSDVAKKAIAGYLDLAPSLTAFGNTNPTSYFRLVPHQEAPTYICWGDRNRSVLVRVPLGWGVKTDMSSHANPLETLPNEDFSHKQTAEFRCPDGSADVYLLLAGLAVAACHGLQMENALEYAEKTYVDVDICDEGHKEKLNQLKTLPLSCWESAQCLFDHSEIYKKHNVFHQSMLDNIIENLRAFFDKDLRDEIHSNQELIMRLVKKSVHCG